ncbi:TlpA family protein disulfide reductase [Actinotalea fermentans]|uniref:Thiol-disulfide isomerase n=1 Tax=Actinotalea fermentans TaxID=43671 RepID=A0A511Z0H7_9CELL|nr:TlpA disulfide reductase family protein [Actinotalea fermentans]KGM15124.1 redoxin [Actinotalea fermentans ATCC 43279 = JCM 9966 = DSM 3133]GEN80948.1 thiol-disulfide isomerase [Actinotalea fermentans]
MGRTTRGAGVAALLALALAACSPTITGGWDEEGAQTGYVSGDRSVVTWDAPDREGPVEIAGTDFAGTAVDVADWRGDVVVLNTWYAQCPPCRAEAPDLVAFAEDYADAGVHVLGINSTDDAGAAQAFERTFAIPYPSVHDADGAAIAALQGIVPVQAVPTTVVLDADGLVAARVLGVIDPSTLRTVVDDLLAEDAG